MVMCAWSNPRYAAIVMDAHTGQILEQENAQAKRHPASLTKKMTLYLLFEAVANGRFKKHALLSVSRHAASQPPSKLGLRAGDQVPIENIIMGLVTRSANDAAMVAAEALGGSQAGFVRMMNRKARELGMKNTIFRNPSGLPDAEQVTTAYDMAVLGRALYRDFPDEYRRFKSKSFVHKGQTILNHNKLLGKVPGVDGIKTGFINASGFNLTASAQRNGKRLIVVVMGGPNRHWRDKRVAELFEKHFGGQAGEADDLMDPADEPALENTVHREESDQTLDDIVQNVSMSDNPDVAKPKPATWVQPTASAVKEKPHRKNKRPKKGPPTEQDKEKNNGLQVGLYPTKLKATAAAKRIAKHYGGVVSVVKTRQKKKTLYAARVLNLKNQNAKAICQELKGKQACLPIAIKS